MDTNSQEVTKERKFCAFLFSCNLRNKIMQNKLDFNSI